MHSVNEPKGLKYIQLWNTIEHNGHRHASVRIEWKDSSEGIRVHGTHMPGYMRFTTNDIGFKEAQHEKQVASKNINP